MSESITITIKSSGDKKYEVTFDPLITVSQLKELVAEKSDIPAGSQRLIYSGKVLKDTETVTSYKVQNGHTIHLVKSAAAATSTGAATTAAAAAGGGTCGESAAGLLTCKAVRSTKECCELAKNANIPTSPMTAIINRKFLGFIIYETNFKTNKGINVMM